MACRRQHSPSNGGLVDWCNVGIVLIGLLLGVGGDEPHVGNRRVEDLVVGLVENLQILVPSGTVQEETVHVATVLGSLGDIVVLAVLGENQEVEGERIDGVFILHREGSTLRA
jgi:hypothetical protein